jgi:hypothetical protein
MLQFSLIQRQATAAFVFDLLGNSSVRFEQYDGTTALPFKINGKFHLGGKIVTTPLAVFRQIIDSFMPIIKAKGVKPAVIIPPLPRYLFTRCCSDADHCTNANEENFSAKLLTNFVQLRNELIKHLVSEGLTNFKIMDSCCVTNCGLTANTASRPEELKKVHGVHFTRIGFTNLAKRCSDCLKTLLGSMSNPKGKKAVPVTFFWQGFRSVRGSLRAKPTSGASARGSFRGWNSGGRSGRSGFGYKRGFHPYRR